MFVTTPIYTARNMMTGKARRIWESLRDAVYRREWASEHVGVGLAFQIRALREARGLTQSQLGQLTGQVQETISVLENPNYGRYSLSTLNKLAAAFDVGLLVRFVPFSELVEWTANVSPERLAPPNFDQEDERHETSAGEYVVTDVEAPMGYYTVTAEPNEEFMKLLADISVPLGAGTFTTTTGTAQGVLFPTEPITTKERKLAAAA